MKVLDLFSGIGGFSLGLERAGMETVAFCEIDPFCQKVLKKHWFNVPIFNDVRSLDYDGTVDVICGGFPCQPFSVAGKRKGKEDDRHLWPTMFSVIKKYRPSWIIGENVTGLINMGLDDVLVDLEGENYSTRTFVIPACAVNAPHRRDRVWIIAHSDSNSKSTGTKYAKKEHVTNTDRIGLQGRRHKSYYSERWNLSQKQALLSFARTRDSFNNLSSPRVCRSNDGIPNRTHRLRALGNAVVPQIPEIIGRAIMEVENG